MGLVETPTDISESFRSVLKPSFRSPFVGNLVIQTFVSVENPRIDSNRCLCFHQISISAPIGLNIVR